MTKTAQDLFNAAWERAKFKKKSSRRASKETEDLNSCYYRGPNGPCFIGVSIPDDAYSPDLEGLSASHFSVANAAGYYGYPNTSLFAARLQEIHDIYPPSRWEKRLRWLAKHWNLEVPE